MQVTKKRILFFIVGSQPTTADLEAAEQLGTQMFRNVTLIRPDDTVEECDAVAGAVPDKYAAKYKVLEAKKPKKAPEKPEGSGSTPTTTQPAANTTPTATPPAAGTPPWAPGKQ